MPTSRETQLSESVGPVVEAYAFIETSSEEVSR